MNWQICKDKAVPFACDECDERIHPHEEFYVSHEYCSLIIVHPWCKDKIEKRLKECLKGN